MRGKVTFISAYQAEGEVQTPDGATYLFGLDQLPSLGRCDVGSMVQFDVVDGLAANIKATDFRPRVPMVIFWAVVAAAIFSAIWIFNANS